VFILLSESLYIYIIDVLAKNRRYSLGQKHFLIGFSGHTLLCALSYCIRHVLKYSDTVWASFFGFFAEMTYTELGHGFPFTVLDSGWWHLMYSCCHANPRGITIATLACLHGL
jgi:hypothetical protein